MESYRTPDDRFDALPNYDFTPEYLEQDGLRLPYLAEGTGDPGLLEKGEEIVERIVRSLVKAR